MKNKTLDQYKDFVWGKHQKISTRETYLRGVKTLLRNAGKPLDQVTIDDVRRYVQWCYDHRSHNGNSLRFWSLRYCFKWMKRKDLEDVVPKLYQRDAGKPALNENEIDKILNSIGQMSAKHQLVFYLEYDAIRRPCEIRDIRLNDRDEYILRYRGKTEHRTGVKQCIMTQRLMDSWDDYLRIRPLPATLDEASYLILNDYGQFKGTHLHDNCSVQRIVKEIMMYARVNLPMGEKPSNYLVKRSSITRQLLDGADIKIVQAQAGHTDPETTLKYHRINEKDIKDYLGLFEHKTSSLKQKRGISQEKTLYEPLIFPQTIQHKNEDEDNNNFSFSFSFFVEITILDLSDDGTEINRCLEGLYRSCGLQFSLSVTEFFIDHASGGMVGAWLVIKDCSSPLSSMLPFPPISSLSVTRFFASQQSADLTFFDCWLMGRWVTGSPWGPHIAVPSSPSGVESSFVSEVFHG